MTQTQFKKEMQVWGDCFMQDTCYTLSAEIVRKIMNNKVMGDFDKMAMLKQYTNNTATNNSIVEAVKQHNTK